MFRGQMSVPGWRAVSGAARTFSWRRRRGNAGQRTSPLRCLLFTYIRVLQNVCGKMELKDEFILVQKNIVEIYTRGGSSKFVENAHS